MKSKKTSPRSFKFKHTFEVTATPIEFQHLSSVKYLDAEALSKVAKTKIDIGFYKCHCCERHVRAVVEAGIVTKLELDPCHDTRPAPPEMIALMKTASKRAGLDRLPKWQPMPIKEFIAKADTVRPADECFELCWLWLCYLCCTNGTCGHTPLPNKFTLHP